MAKKLDMKTKVKDQGAVEAQGGADLRAGEAGEAARLHPPQRRLHRLPRLRDRLQGQERPAAGAALPPRDVRRGRPYPDVFAYKVNMSCNHCAEPACLPTCPTGAIWKREADGIVDIDSTLCIGCRRCEAACPYGAPQWNPKEQIVQKCNMCVDEIEAGRKPYCVMACMMRVLDIGPIDCTNAAPIR
jgi:Fe-S-cluster-containing dehydrogenase component